MSLLFKPEHIEAIRAGKKSVTRRDWADGYHRPSEGDIRMAVTEMFTTDEDCECYIRITNTQQEPLGDITEQDARFEGGYSLPEFRDLWAKLHGDWNPDLVVDVITFVYVGRVRPENRECAECGSENVELGFIADYDVYCHDCEHLDSIKAPTEVENDA